MTMRNLILAGLLAVASAGPALAGGVPVGVMKAEGCGCCVAWMDHLRDSGFAPEGQNLPSEHLYRYKMMTGVPQSMYSCHTAMVDGYVIEGHVPAADIQRLLAERPQATGLAVPDMPLGSPGMDYGDERQPYNVYLIKADGSTEVFSSYKGR